MPKLNLTNFDASQTHQILMGIYNNLDVSKYANNKLNASQMYQIRLGLEQMLNVETYSNPEFDALQMAEIREGMLDGLNVTYYADPSFPNECMNIIRMTMLSFEYDEFKILLDKWTPEQMLELYMGLIQHLDVTKYANMKYDGDQMRVLRTALSENCDISFLTEKEMNAEQMLLLHEYRKIGIDLRPIMDRMNSDNKECISIDSLRIALKVYISRKVSGDYSDAVTIPNRYHENLKRQYKFVNNSYTLNIEKLVDMINQLAVIIED